MFSKPFRIKSQTAVRSSDRKKIKASVSTSYPSLTEEELSMLFPNKEEMSSMKVYSHGGENVMVYCLKKNPIFFEVEGIIYPTVYTMWQVPHLLQCFTTHTPVIGKLQGGADLMLPGIVTAGPVYPDTFKHIQKGDRCAVNAMDNRAAMAVGITAMDGSDMYESGMRGKGVQILHVYKDHLWAHGEQLEPPQLGPVVLPCQGDDDVVTSDDAADVDQDDVDVACNNQNDVQAGAPNVEATSHDICEITEAMQATGIGENAENADCDEDEIDEEEIFQETTETMDDLLYHCFMCALIAEVKDDDLPLLTSKLLRSCMVPWCPNGRMLDVKKSSYKKLTKFLQSMGKRKLAVVKELSKGVESITEIDRRHEEYRQFVLPPKPVPPIVDNGAEPQKAFQAPKLEELYAVSGNTVPIFKGVGIGKGVPLGPTEVRKYVKEYVKSNNLTVDRDPRLVTLDAVLSDALLNKGERDTTHLHWDQLFARCMEKMSPVMRITYPNQESKIVKGKLQNIQLSVAQRAGNKKVTLIDNLEQFGIDEAAFAHEVQIGVAGSTAVQPAPGKKGQQVLVQGNQIVFVAGLLMGKYGLNKKYITGLDKAPKGKKKR